MEIIPVQEPQAIAVVADLAQRIWTQHYVPIIGQAQVAYMLQGMQSVDAITQQINQGCRYYLATQEGEAVGYLALIKDAAQQSLMISKLYVLKTRRGQGLGSRMLAWSEQICQQEHIRRLWLTVNKQNSSSIAWYQERGFINCGSVQQDIGGGFLMDDYRMEKVLSEQLGIEAPEDQT